MSPRFVPEMGCICHSPSGEFVEQRLCLFEIGRVETFGEPAPNTGVFHPVSRRFVSMISRSVATARRGRCSLAMFHVAVVSALIFMPQQIAYGCNLTPRNIWSQCLEGGR